MNKMWMNVIFLAGLLTVGWVAWGFVGTSWLALVTTGLIGVVFVAGTWELRRFRVSTHSLQTALAQPPQADADLSNWLERIDASLRAAVRMRLEGERVALPAPVLTPYLVGLLVMLGMLGTFLGMVVTFKGAVFALQGTADLEAIRAALAEPIKGLGLAFGTSVAGVATSALLGLMSSLCRRERIGVARALDQTMGDAMQAHSSSHQRRIAVQSLQVQADHLPRIVDRLQALSEQLDAKQAALSAQLISQQQAFQAEAAQTYQVLAQTVSASLKDSLTETAQTAATALQHAVQSAMQAIAQEGTLNHQRLMDVTQGQLQALSEQWQGAARKVSESWVSALAVQQQSQSDWLTRLDGSLQSFGQTLDARAQSMLTQWGESVAQQQLHQQQQAQVHVQQWQAAMQSQNQAQQVLQSQLDQALQQVTQGFEQRSAELLQAWQQWSVQQQAMQTQGDAQRVAAWSDEMQRLSQGLGESWQVVATQTLAQQQAVCERLERSTDAITTQASEQVGQAVRGLAALLDQSESLMRTRVEGESAWLQAQADRMAELSAVWRTELQALRDEEAQRGAAAVSRLDALQAAVAQHLASLGASLEAPLTRLLQTAAEVPQAAADVVTQLRHEISHISERDNLALAERQDMMARMAELLQTVQAASVSQQQAIEALVASANGVMQQASAQFNEALMQQASKVDDVAAHVAASAVELASLGESFSESVNQFNAGNEKLAVQLGNIEVALSQSIARSDEQLAYYVAQAREVIDLSISSQQGILDDLRRLHQQSQTMPVGAAA